MTTISHHIPDDILLAYAAGNLPDAFSLVVATHISSCDECRARLAAHEAAGGAILETHKKMEISADLRARVFDGLDAPVQIDPAPLKRSGVFPGPVMERLKGKPPKWRQLGGGVKQVILDHGPEGSVRLLHIPGGQAVPDHSHHGLELTLVLDGSFHDETGCYRAGDLQVADDSLEHTPIADEGRACICLAATEGPLKFNAFLPRILQPIFRI